MGRPSKLCGLALSGGGVRSATFNLGLLQALAAAGKLKAFDYLSTVSGGGYVGGWWSAWLSRKERDDEPGQVFPPVEDIESERDERRTQLRNASSRPNVDRPQIKDSALTAGEDPIHHLRLFSNVMTPRKGLLSADTWRAVAVISRNIALTWMILLPILLAAILIGQAWFTLGGEPASLVDRLGRALAIPGLLFIGSLVCIFFWMLFSRRWQTLADKLVAVLSTLAFLALTVFLLIILGVRSVSDIPMAVYAAIGFWIVYVTARLIWWKVVHQAKWGHRDFWRNRIVNVQTKTLSYSVFALIIFLFAGFGYLIFDFLVRAGEVTVAKAGGWSAAAMAIVSSIYTALKAAPTGGGDTPTPKKPSLLQRVMFAVAPTLFLLLLGIVLSWIGRQLYLLVMPSTFLVQFVTRGALVSAFLFLVFALYEFRPPQKWKGVVVVAAWVVVVAAASTIRPGTLKDYLVPMGAAALGLLAVALIIRAVVRRQIWISWYAILLAITALWIGFSVDPSVYTLSDPYLPQFVISGVVATLVLLLFELIQGRGANTRSITLTVIGSTIFVLVGAAMGAGAKGSAALTLVGLIATILGWVLALGWLSDPNLLTMHGFYKARLIRAYMGASNVLRGKSKDADITDAVPGDDLLLTQLRNTERGAPYHLINTMLNLVGGHDLSTQARASDSFTMSKLYCGSVRTGFRPTNEYACGSISLGTAVAVSGAAASPSMGAQSPSAALSALMTLFNVRLGYWAPTPSLSYWRSGSARLWPVYTLQELVSQTTDLLPYCNLTDGGHYENTGVYSLIQRGCNVIVVGDCGMDPDVTLDDLGNMIRKVRIDFGTEINLDVAQLRTKPPGVHVIVGEILYGPDHAAALGLPPGEEKGTIIVVKPNLALADGKPLPVDVQQYGFKNTDFPQQGTFDLWYDEAQFESYRRLGEESGRLAVALGVL
ncbi:MAG TPA: patatin-like phospholipase family protein [Thermoanaerobaculia bacterium]|nr:patatin-like phospholipase family protein [Thermoanaerobaculia bacterium]